MVQNDLEGGGIQETLATKTETLCAAVCGLEEGEGLRGGAVLKHEKPVCCPCLCPIVHAVSLLFLSGLPERKRQERCCTALGDAFRVQGFFTQRRSG